MGKDKPICDSKEHVQQAQENAEQESLLGQKFWSAIGMPIEGDKSTVACTPKEQAEALRRPKLSAKEEEQVTRNVQSLEAAIKTGDLTKVGELFNQMAPRADHVVKPDEFHKRSGVKVTDETMHRLNKELDKYGINLDYRSMGVYQGDRSPSLIISREAPKGNGITEHLEVTLQGGSTKEFMRHSGTDRVTITENGPTSFDKVAGVGNKTGAEVAYQEIMKPYLDAKKGK